MPIHITFDGTNAPELPVLVLATKNGTKLGALSAISDVTLTDSMSDASELSFTVHKEMDGVPFQLWDEVLDFRLVWCKEWDRWFSIEVKTTETGETVKDVTAYSLGEYELSQILLFDTEINTEADIQREDYISPTVLYDSNRPECSLIHRVLSKAPHYRVSYVDATIQNLQRTFSFNNKSIKDAFDEVAEEIGCLFVYEVGSDENGLLDRTIAVYDLEQTCLSCGYRGEFTGVCPACGSDNVQHGYGNDTTIFVSTDNLTQEVSYETDIGSVKNCFHLSAGDDLMTATIRACNPAGGSYLWYIPEEIRSDMTPELRAALASYDERNDLYTNTMEYELDADLLAAYNTLINKYSEYNSDLSPITSPVVGYAALMQHYFDVLDFGIFLQTSLMPEVVIPEKTAASQAALITQSSMSPVAVSSLTESTSRATAESAIKTVVRALIDTAQFSFVVNTESWSNPNWTGTVTVTSRTENDQGIYESATSERMSLVFTADYATYLRQVIDKKMKAADTDDLSISSVLSGSLDSLVARLGQYSYDCLSSMADCCQDVLNVLIDAGATNQWSNVQDDLYTPYYNKLVAIQSEMGERADEIEVVVGNTDSGVTGLQQVIEQLRSQVQDALDLQTYLGENGWLELCSYRREDEYSNSNYVSDGLSNAELITNALEFLKKARKEIFKSATLQHSISSTLSNLLAIDAFKPLLSYFEVGNWIRVRVDDVVYRLRLLSYTVDFSSFSQVQVEFSDVTKNIDGTSDVSSLLGKASAMSSSFSYVQKQATNGADSKNILENWVANGLATTQAKIMDSADNQDIVWDKHGMIFRRYDPITEQYDPKQLKIINSTMAITDNDWRSTKTAVGRFFYQDPVSQQYVEAYGINAETIVGKLLLGEELGIYNTSGSLTFNKNGLSVSNANNSVVINPNSTTLFKITKGADNLLSVDSSGNLHINGEVTASSGSIAGFTIESGAIRYGNLDSVANSSVALSSTTNFSRVINGSSRSDLRFAIGGKFGIAKDGAMYASGATISGSITATSLTLSNGLTVGTVGANSRGVSISSDGRLQASDAELRGTIHASGGDIANWSITAGKIYGGDSSSGVAVMQRPSNNMTYVFAAGGYSHNSYADCPFRVTKGGVVYAETIHTAAINAYSYGEYEELSIKNAIIEDSILQNGVYLNDPLLLGMNNNGSTPAITAGSHSHQGDNDTGYDQMFFGPPNEYTVTTSVRGTYVRLYCHSGGAIYKGNSGSDAINSDENLKDLYEIDPRYETFFMNLHPMLYKYKRNGHRIHIGYGARSVETALVSAGLDTQEFAGILIDRNVIISADEAETEEDQFYETLYSLRYEEFGPLYAHMLQKAIRKIEALTSRISALEGKE